MRELHFHFTLLKLKQAYNEAISFSRLSLLLKFFTSNVEAQLKFTPSTTDA